MQLPSNTPMLAEMSKEQDLETKYWRHEETEAEKYWDKKY